MSERRPPATATPVTVDGIAELFVCAVPGDGDKDTRGQLSVALYRVDTSGARTSLGTDSEPAASPTVPKWGSTGYKNVTMEVDIGPFVLLPTERLEVVVSSQSNTGMHILYDMTGCKATFTLATTS